MSDAPETVWLDWNPGLAVTQGPLASPPRTQYIRADVAVPKVKPLQWTYIRRRLFACAHLAADCPFGRYRYYYRDKQGFGWKRPGASGFQGFEPSGAAAAAAIQADYERRVLDALQ